VHVAGPSTSYSAARRAAEWRATMADAGLAPQDPAQGDWTTASGYRIGKELGQRADITAIVAANDQMALGIMHALHELGRDVPGDISVVGFDDTEESSSFWPPLTTVHQDFTEIGRRSMQVLLEMLEGREPSGDRIVPTRLVVRESAAAPRA
jgi:DNA-binding LacI/PurR family transcriptional regulator